MLKDKAMIDTILPLLPHVNDWVVCSLLSDCEERGSDGTAIAGFLQSQGKNCYTFKTVSAAMDFLARSDCQQEWDRALIFGSFYTVAAAKRWFAKRRFSEALTEVCA